MEYEEIVRRRDELEVGQYASEFGTLREANWHRNWVTPIQESSHDPTGPVVWGVTGRTSPPPKGGELA